MGLKTINDASSESSNDHFKVRGTASAQGLVNNSLINDNLADVDGTTELPYFDKSWADSHDSLMKYYDKDETGDNISFPFYEVRSDAQTNVGTGTNKIAGSYTAYSGSGTPVTQYARFYQFDSKDSNVRFQIAENESTNQEDPSLHKGHFVETSQAITHSSTAGYFPFNNVNKANEKQHNLGFGTKYEMTFKLQSDGCVGVVDENGNDLDTNDYKSRVHTIFEFEGDDDLWVFIDGKLAMDIGGIHQPTNGTINFTTQKVMVNGSQQTGFDFSQLYDGNKHTLQVFYIERGGCDSNCKIMFNMTQYGDVECDKVDSADNTQLLPGAVFGLYKDQACTEPLMETLTNGSRRVFVAESDHNGHVEFKDVPLGTYYLKEIGAPAGYPLDPNAHPVVVYLDETTGVVRVKVTIDGADTEQGVKITNTLPEPINLGLKKVWQNKDGQEIIPTDNATATFELKRIRTHVEIEEEQVEGDEPNVSKLVVGWIHDGEKHTYKEYTLVSGTQATVSWSYENSYTGQIACYHDDALIEKSAVPTNIYSEAFTMPAANQTTTFYIVDNSETGEAIGNINVAGSEYIGNSGGGVIHKFETISEPDTSFQYTGDTNVQNNRVTLPINNSWEYNFTNLPLAGKVGDTTYNYSYYLEEVSTENPSETTIIYKDTNGNPINAPSAAETSQSGTQEIINQVPTGYLQINKSVTWNGEDPTTAEQKSALAGAYKFKVYTDENCSKPYKVKQGDQVVDLELTVTIGEDGTAQSSDKVKLPLGDYWIEEQTPSQNGVTPEANRIKVTVTAENTSDAPALASVINNKEDSDNPDEMAIDLEKVFTGLPDASKIPADYQASLQYTYNGNTVTVPLTGSTVTNVTCTKSADGLTWHWHVVRIPTTATNFAVSESNYDIPGYTRITKINEQQVDNPSEPHQVNVLVPTITMVNATNEYTTSDKMKIFTVADNQILLVRMTSHATVVVSQKSLGIATRTAIENYLTGNGGKVPGDNAQAQWVMNFVYFSQEIQGNSFSYGGRTIYFDGNTVKVPHNASSHEVRVDINYVTETAENSFVIENKYQEVPTSIDVLKVDAADATTHLKDAVFELRQLKDVAPTEGGTLSYVTDGDGHPIVVSKTSDGNGKLTFEGLTSGYYEISELTPPPGYQLSEEVVLYVKVDAGVVSYIEKGTGKPSTWGPAQNSSTVSFTPAQADPAANATFQVSNTSGAALPHTGGPGTMLFTLAGLVLVAAAGILLVRRKPRLA